MCRGHPRFVSLARLYTNNEMYDLASTELPHSDPEEGGKWFESLPGLRGSAIRRGDDGLAVQTAKQALDALEPAKQEDPWLWVVGGEGALTRVIISWPSDSTSRHWESRSGGVLPP